MDAVKPVDAAPPLHVNGARKRFGSVQALDGASIEVRRGELVGLLGPNGAGKTTLIRAIAGRLKLDAGSVHVAGRALSAGDRRPEIGVAPQELAIYPLLTATENLEVFGALYGVPREALADRVRWALAWSDLGERANEPTKRFSGGMKRRLNIACSLMHAPSLVLLDEPTVGVDPQSRERIYEMLAERQRAGVSIVLTTHHLEEAERRCERIVIIDRGRTVANGTVADLLKTTVGATRRLRLRLEHPLGEAASLPAGLDVSAERREVTAEVTDAGREVADRIGQVIAAGGQIADVSLSSATLQDVFISLTGRELRE